VNFYLFSNFSSQDKFIFKTNLIIIVVDLKILKNICLISSFLIVFYFYLTTVYAQCLGIYDCSSVFGEPVKECMEVSASGVYSYSGSFYNSQPQIDAIRGYKHIWNISTIGQRANITMTLTGGDDDTDDLNLYLRSYEGVPCVIGDSCDSETLGPLQNNPESVFVKCKQPGKWKAEVETLDVLNCAPYDITIAVENFECCYNSDCPSGEICIDGYCTPGCLDPGEDCAIDSECCDPSTGLSPGFCNIDEIWGSRCCVESCPEDGFTCSAVGDVVYYNDYFCDVAGTCTPAQYTKDKTKPDSNGFIRDWLMLGYFFDRDCEGCPNPWIIPGDGCDNWFDFAYTTDLSNPNPPAAGDKLPTGHTWFIHHDNDQWINLDNIFEPGVNNEQVTAFAFAYIESPTTRTVKLEFTYDDSITIWLNGNIEVDKSGDCTWYGGKSVQLNQGSNRLLIRVGQNTGNWVFENIRFVDPTNNDNPITDINISLPTNSYDCTSFNGIVSYNFTDNWGCGIFNRTHETSYSCSARGCVQTISNEVDTLVSGINEGLNCRYDRCDALTRYYDYTCTAGECSSPIVSCDDGKVCSYDYCRGSGTFNSYCDGCTQEGHYNSVGTECSGISCCYGLTEKSCLGGETACCPPDQWYNSSWTNYPCFRNRTVEYRVYECPAVEGGSCSYTSTIGPIEEKEYINEGLQCGVGDFECLDGCTKGRKLSFCQSGNCVAGNEYAGLVGYWKLDEESGNIVYDSSIYGNDGLINDGSCSSAREYSTINVRCPSGEVITSIENSVYVDENSPASCSNPDPAGFCNRYCDYANNCIGQNSCSFTVNNGNCGGDPCPGAIKKLILNVNCTNSNGWVEGKVGNALQFDGIDDYIEVEDHPSLGGMSQLTVEAWIKLNQLPRFDKAEYVLRKHNSDWTYSYALYGYSNNWCENCLRFLVKSESGASVGAGVGNILLKNIWYHVVGVYNGDQVQLYINGLPSGWWPSLTGNVFDSNRPLYIGAWTHDGTDIYSPFNGTIDEVKIYNYALTDEEIFQEYQKGLEGHPSNASSCSPFSCDSQSSWGCSFTCDSACGAPACDNLSPYSSCGTNNYCNYDCECKVNCAALDSATCALFDDCEVCTGDGTCKFKTGGGLPITSDTVALWHFGEGTGQILSDATLVNNGTLGSTSGSDVNDPTWVADETGYSLTFNKADGTNDYVIINPYIDGMPQLTVEAWIKFDMTPSETRKLTGTSLVTIMHSSSIWFFGNAYYDSFSFMVYNGINSAWPGTGGLIKKDVWYHVVGVYDGSWVRIYVNGIPHGWSSPLTGNVFDSDEPLKIGYYYNTFNGTIDEARILNRALTPEEILADYNAGRTHPTLQCEFGGACAMGPSQYCANNCQWSPCPGTDIECGCDSLTGNCTSCPPGTSCVDHVCKAACDVDECEFEGTCYESGTCKGEDLCMGNDDWDSLAEHCGDGVCLCENVNTCPQDCRFIDYYLRKGWNLISLPYKKITGIILDECNADELPFFYWENNIWKKTVGIMNIEGGYGYWVNPEWHARMQGQICVINATANIGEEITVDDLPVLYRGYNEIGAPLGSVNINDIKGTCEITQEPLYWSAYDKDWLPTGGILQEKRGYWVYVENNVCKLST